MANRAASPVASSEWLGATDLISHHGSLDPYSEVPVIVCETLLVSHDAKDFLNHLWRDLLYAMDFFCMFGY
jgi:hypothetical protein